MVVCVCVCVCVRARACVRVRVCVCAGIGRRAVIGAGGKAGPRMMKLLGSPPHWFSLALPVSRTHTHTSTYGGIREME